MKKKLIEVLICPACLPEQNRLKTKIEEENADDIYGGSLTCTQCGMTYPIRKGIAFFDQMSFQKSKETDSKYETAAVLSSYLWSHYGNLLQDSNASSAYSEWVDLINPHTGVTIDAGSAVGRFSFEMTRKSDFVIGIDNSFSFVQAARELMIKRERKIDLKLEGRLTEEKRIVLPESWDSNKLEFIVGDAQALPFRSNTFGCVASLNLVDKIPVPLRHLEEMNRVAEEKDAQFIFSDPFSWSEDVAKEEDWLGGTEGGRHPGRGVENITALLKGEKSGLLPPWKVEKRGHVWWKIRTHANHYELIRSCFVKAFR